MMLSSHQQHLLQIMERQGFIQRSCEFEEYAHRWVWYELREANSGPEVFIDNCQSFEDVTFSRMFLKKEKFCRDMECNHCTLNFWVSSEETLEVNFRASRTIYKATPFWCSKVVVKKSPTNAKHLNLEEIKESTSDNPFDDAFVCLWEPLGNVKITLLEIIEAVSALALDFPYFTYSWYNFNQLEEFNRKHPEEELRESHCEIFSNALAAAILKGTPAHVVDQKSLMTES